MTVLQRIRKEYDEPFKEVVKGYAEMGFSKNLTAKTLGISRPTLEHHCKRFDLLKFFKPHAE